MKEKSCCLTCSMFQLLADRYPDGFDSTTGSDIMESLAKVAAFLLKNADEAFLPYFAAQVRFERDALLEAEGVAPATDTLATAPAASQAVN